MTKTRLFRYVLIGLLLVSFIVLAISIPRFNQAVQDTNNAAQDFFATQPGN